MCNWVEGNGQLKLASMWGGGGGNKISGMYVREVKGSLGAMKESATCEREWG